MNINSARQAWHDCTYNPAPGQTSDVVQLGVVVQATERGPTANHAMHSALAGHIQSAISEGMGRQRSNCVILARSAGIHAAAGRTTASVDVSHFFLGRTGSGCAEAWIPVLRTRMTTMRA